MTTGTLDNLYFEWLYKSIGLVKNTNPRRSYWALAKQLYEIPFSWSIRLDENRAEDGRYLREEFFADNPGIEFDKNWYELDCSMLEMFIGLARRASFQTYGEPGDWFWKFMDNLELREYNDAVYSRGAEKVVADTMSRIIAHRYARNGDGGIFPLPYAEKDQRKVELACQLSNYLLEGGYIDHGP